VPVIGVIEPGVRRALQVTKNKKIGVIGTEATIQSGAYTKALKTQGRNMEVYSRACPLFVPLVEEGWTDNTVVAMTVEAYLGSLKRSGIDTLILGCTHYPLLKNTIREFLGHGVTLVDSAEEVAKDVGALLKKHSLVRRNGKGVHSFFVTDAPDRFIEIGRRFLGDQVESAVRIER
jgi:glutamate racemase